jgi:hypothetical protein
MVWNEGFCEYDSFRWLVLGYISCFKQFVVGSNSSYISTSLRFYLCTLYKHSLIAYYEMTTFPCINLICLFYVLYLWIIIIIIIILLSRLILYCTCYYYNDKFYIHLGGSLEYWIKKYELISPLSFIVWFFLLNSHLLPPPKKEVYHTLLMQVKICKIHTSEDTVLTLVILSRHCVT